MYSYKQDGNQRPETNGIVNTNIPILNILNNSMADIRKHLIYHKEPLSTALQMLETLGEDLTLFAINEEGQLMGTLTDGDVRRGLLRGLLISDSIDEITNTKFSFIRKGNYKVSEISEAKKLGIQILPVLDEKNKIVRLINFLSHKSYLPVDTVIMAGGEGIRLRPMTQNLPKPMLKVGEKPIIEHTIDRLVQFGIENIQISINYMGDKIQDFLRDGSHKNIRVSYIIEKDKLGTIGSVSLAAAFHNDNVLIMNSDLLTNIDLEEFFTEFAEKQADMSVACVPYVVNIPYAIMETDSDKVLSLKEKPNITYHSNAGIYLIKKEHLEKIPKNTFFNATDLIEKLIAENKKVTYYPILGYWLDIGKMDDFHKAQQDIKHIKL
jgi:dTDP-glucose pyrophosphorylase